MDRSRDVFMRQFERVMVKTIVSYGWLVLFLLGVGCADKKPSSLTEVDVIRKRVQQKPLSPTVLSVSGETITLDRVMDITVSTNNSLGAAPLGGILTSMAQEENSYDQFEKLALPLATRSIDQEVSSILLYQKLKREAGDKLDEGLEKIADRDWNEFVLEKGHGNVAVAEELLRSQNLNRTKYKDNRKRWYLTQFYISKKMSMDRPIGHKEILDYFERQKDTVFAKDIKITFRLIDIQANQMTGENQAMDRMAAALELAQDLTQRLHEGADFADLAKRYSHGHMARLGGLWPPRDPNSLAAPYDVLARVAEQLQPGDISKPVVSGQHVFIMKLENRESRGTKPLAQVQPEIENQISSDRQNEMLQPLYKELAEQAQVGDIDSFIHACLRSIYDEVHSRQG